LANPQGIVVDELEIHHAMLEVANLVIQDQPGDQDVEPHSVPPKVHSPAAVPRVANLIMKAPEFEEVATTGPYLPPSED